MTAFINSLYNNFIAGMDQASMKTLGENGTPEWTDGGVGDARVVLFNIVRDTPDQDLRNKVDAVLQLARSKKDMQVLVDLFATVFLTRNCRGGKGEKALFYKMLLHLYHEFPETVVGLLDLVPHYGYWKDYQLILEMVNGSRKETYAHLVNRIYEILVNELENNKKEIQLAKIENRTPKISFVAKFIPKEGKHFDRATNFVSNMCKLMFNDTLTGVENKTREEREKTWNYCKKQYRRIVSEQNKLLDTPEIKMAGKRWAEIQFSKVASLCLDRHRKAFLNEKLKGTLYGSDEEEKGNRHPYDVDRVACRQNLIKTLVDPSKIKGARLFPHEITNKAWRSQLSTVDKKLLQAQWDSMKSDVVKTFEEFTNDGNGVNLGNLVSLVDVSGSMSGTPMEVAVALGILVSELAAPAFRDRFLTFSARPTWHNLSGCGNLIDKVNSTRRAPWGGNTNFELALNQILDVVVKNKLAPEDIPDLIVFSDMQFDMANGRGNWDTAHQRLVKKFRDAGMRVCGKPYDPPTIIYWNLRGNTRGHAAQANTPGVRMLSGYSPSLLKLLLSGEDLDKEVEVVLDNGTVVKKKQEITPYETFRKAVDDPLYDLVRAVLVKVGELERRLVPMMC